MKYRNLAEIVYNERGGKSGERKNKTRENGPSGAGNGNGRKATRRLQERSIHMRLRPLFKSVGGKFYLAPKMYPHLPPREKYDKRGENFGRGFSLSLLLEPSREEYWNDLNHKLYNIYAQLRDPRFADELRVLKYDEERFNWAKSYSELRTDDMCMFAVACFVVLNMSRGGSGTHFAWSDRQRGGQPGDVNGWETRLAQLPAIQRRMSNVRLFNEDGITLVEKQSSEERTFQYLDPPYYPSTRTAPRAFASYEMTIRDHERLLDACVMCKGPIMLSGYSCVLYNEKLKNWNVVRIDMPNHAGQGETKQRRVECLWMNY